MTHVKICGIRSAADADVAASAGADYLGMVFAPSVRSVSLEDAAAIRRAAGSGPPRVGVFVDPTLEAVTAAIEAGGLDYVQLHGRESPELCRQITVPVIKALHVGADDIEASLGAYDVNAFLVDTYVAGEQGGSGRTFDWRPARAWSRRCRLFLAGGLVHANVADAVRMVRPFAVDVSSGTESAPGVKDGDLVERFIAAVRDADRRLTEGAA